MATGEGMRPEHAAAFTDADVDRMADAAYREAVRETVRGNAARLAGDVPLADAHWHAAHEAETYWRHLQAESRRRFMLAYPAPARGTVAPDSLQRYSPATRTALGYDG